MVYELCLVAVINKKDKEIFVHFQAVERQTLEWSPHGDFYMVLLQQCIGLSV